MKRKILIAIDGPSGAGKSTLAKAIAEKLDIMHLDTGALFRALGYAALIKDFDTRDAKQAAELIKQVELGIEFENKNQKVLLNGKDVTPYLRTEDVSIAASNISVHPVVRDYILLQERQLAERESFVLDGRDIGTVVLPNADVKVFLIASPQVRARRRLLDLINAGNQNAEYEQVLQDIERRDHQDSNRQTAPTKMAADAVLIDSSNLTIEETVAQVLALVEQIE
ncbi:MAG TPA: (d)CMP kinase [Clostridiaceae bacterium]|nr:(d)CMP kinase [Clostridiaceae bacterium]